MLSMLKFLLLLLLMLLLLLLMLLLKVVGMLLKYELIELGITSGSLIMMPFSLMEVIDVRFLPIIVLMLDHTFLLFPK